MTLVMFDFDGTLFTKETLPFILKYWKNKVYKLSNLCRTYWRIAKLVLVYKTPWGPKMDKKNLSHIGGKRFHKII